MKKQTTYRLTEKADAWLKSEAEKQGLSKNDIVQMLINEKMKDAS